MTPAEVRERYRAGLVAPSSGEAPGYTQANLVVLPRDWAYEMLLFGQRNPQPVPLLDVTDAGSYRTQLAPDADLRTDLPKYRVWAWRRPRVLGLRSDTPSCVDGFQASVRDHPRTRAHVRDGRT